MGRPASKYGRGACFPITDCLPPRSILPSFPPFLLFLLYFYFKCPFLADSVLLETGPAPFKLFFFPMLLLKDNGQLRV